MNFLFYSGRQQLKDRDFLRLQSVATRNAWLGCPHTVCDLRRCPSMNHNYRDFNKCSGEVFQIIGEGDSPIITSGRLIRLKYIDDHNTWMGCPTKKYCSKKRCPGSELEAKNFAKCGGEMFRIYARGKTLGQAIHNGDVVMLHFENDGRYVSINGQNEGDDTSIDFCPGRPPPAYLSYGICSKNAFRIYKKPPTV